MKHAWKKGICFGFGIFVLFFIFFLFKTNRAEKKLRPYASVGNPAAIYCTEVMGYEYRIDKDENGAERGVCVLPDEQECDQWDFYAGSCGASYSYCVQEGYEIETRTDGDDPFSANYAACLTSEGELAGTTVELSPLSALISQLNNSFELPVTEGEPNETGALSGVTAPPSWDWRNYDGENWLSPVRNQSSCGSCWAFAAIGITEAHHNIISGNPDLNLDLSEQELVSCAGAGDCSGGYSTLALDYIKNTGVSDEACFPYTASNSACNKCADWATRLTSIDNYHYQYYSASSATIKDKLINYGPVVVYMGISSEFDGYWDGDIYRCRDDSSINHGVVIVGYNDAGSYWIVRNSWGANWNSDGYFKVGYDECAIEDVLLAYAETYEPATPTNFRVTNTEQYSISLAWDDVGSETGYRIYRKEDANFVQIGSVNANTTSYTDEDVSCNESYEYKLGAYNNYGESPLTDALTASTLSTCPDIPDNDDFDHPDSVTSPSTTDPALDTREATSDPDDPDLAECNISGSGKATVWYHYHADADTAISVDTRQATYDTFIAVWTGTRNDLELVACNDDIDATKRSAVAFQVSDGTDYYIEVGQP